MYTHMFRPLHAPTNTCTTQSRNKTGSSPIQFQTIYILLKANMPDEVSGSNANPEPEQPDGIIGKCITSTSIT